MRTVEAPEESSSGSEVPSSAPAPAPPAADASTDQATTRASGGIDWSGRAPAGGSDDDGDRAPEADAAGGSGTRRLAVVAGIVSFAYVLWVIVDLVVLASSGVAYTTMHRALGSLGFRLVLCGAWLALLYHGLDGIRVALIDAAPGLGERDRFLRGAVAFLLFGAWIPTALVIMWPAIRGWFAA